MSINRICVPAVAGPSRMARHAFLRSSAPAINPSLYGRSQFSTAPIRSQSRRQAYTLAHPVDTQSGFEGIPAAGYSGPVDAKSTSGKGKEKAVEPREGHAPPPPPPTSQEAKPRRKIQSKKAAITMTPTAVERLRALMSTPNPQLLRIGVKTRGCAGMAYHLEYVSPPGGKFDEVVEQDGVRVLIDSKALFSIIGSRMDWRDTRLSAGFVFDNPNVVDSCGCGESFNIRF